MEKKLKNFRLSEETIAQIDYLQRVLNKEMPLNVTNTDVVSIAIQRLYEYMKELENVGAED